MMTQINQVILPIVSEILFLEKLNSINFKKELKLHMLKLTIQIKKILKILIILFLQYLVYISFMIYLTTLMKLELNKMKKFD